MTCLLLSLPFENESQIIELIFVRPLAKVFVLIMARYTMSGGPDPPASHICARHRNAANQN
jgi:hypothetical protein